MELDTYFRFLIALIAVIALIAGLAWTARRFGLGGAVPLPKGAAPRLAVLEIKAIDSRRKLVLFRRDQREHLVLLGTGQDLLIESIGEEPRP